MIIVVPIRSAAKAPGIYFPTFLGQKKTIRSVKIPSPKACKFGAMAAAGMAFNALIVPPPSTSCPRRFAPCRAIMITPIPLINPEMTG